MILKSLDLKAAGLTLDEMRVRPRSRKPAWRVVLVAFLLVSALEVFFASPAAAQELSVFTQSGVNRGAPGERANAVGSLPEPGCPTIFIFFDATQVASVPTHQGGRDFSGGIFDIPKDARFGAHTVRVSCDSSGLPEAESVLFSVFPKGFNPIVRFANPDRTEFVEHTPPPQSIDWSIKRIARNLFLALLAMILLIFPSQLFNSTLEENYDEVRGWFGLKEPKDRSQGSSPRVIAAFILVGGILYGFLSPGFGFNKASFNLYIGLVAALAATSFLFGIAASMYVNRKHGDRGRLSVLPGSLVVAAVCVVVSRMAHFAPGYFYGVLAGFAFQAEMSREDEAKSTGLSFLWMFAAGIVAWLLWGLVARSAGQAGASLPLLVLDAMLAALFVAGLETTVFGLIPIKFMAGKKLFDENKAWWGALFGLGMFGFFHVLLDPASDYLPVSQETPVKTTFLLFILFGLVSVAFWGYFRYRKPKPEPTERETAG